MRALSKVAPDRAPVTASVISGIDAHHGAALNSGPWANSAASYVKDGEESLNGLSDALQKRALITAEQRVTIRNAVQQAAAHQNRISTAPGSAYDTISQMQNLPPSVRGTLLDGLDHLDTASSSKLLRNSKGPLEKVGATAGGLTPVLGHHMGFGMLEAPAGVLIGGAIGRGLDNKLGLAKAPAQRLNSAAQRVLDITGQEAADNPITAAQALTAAYAAPAPLTTAQKFAQSEAAQAAAAKAAQARSKVINQAFSRAERDGIQQGYSANTPPDILDNPRYWPSGSDPAEDRRIAQLTRSQVSGFNADAQSLSRRAASDAREQERGTSLLEGAGAWLERQQVKQFKRENPDVSFPGAAVLRPGGDLFTASGGRAGSPAAPPEVNFGVPQEGLLKAPRNVPPRSTSQAQAARIEDSEAAAMGAPQAFQPELRGGQVLINHKLTDQRLQPAIHSEIVDAVNESALSGLPPEIADAILAGQNTDGYTARYLARMVHHQRTGAPHPGNYDAEAASAVQNAFASVPPVPNGPSNMGAPINNLHRYQNTVDSYQKIGLHMSGMAHRDGHLDVAAGIPALMLERTAAGKQAVYQDLLAKNPAAAAYIPPQLLKGID